MAKPKKRFGQHFLNDTSVLLDIAEAVPDIEGAIVLEIGPGEGALTEHLLKRFGDRLWVNEIDNDLVPHLLMRFPELQHRLIHKDFLQVDWTELPEGPIVVVGNFPYNISSQILFTIWENVERVPAVVGMFQKEVAERVLSGPGSKNYGILSVLLAAYYDTGRVLDVAPEAFRPPPKVWSTVVKLERYQTKVAECNMGHFKEVVKLAFGQRRKMLRNSLSRYVSALEHRPETRDFLTRRPEQLSLHDFILITQTATGE